MLFKNFALAALSACFALAANGIQAMTPQVRLPEWQNSKIDISEWKPDQNLLTVRVAIEASELKLEKVSSLLHLPAELTTSQDLRERPLMKKGEKAVFLHQVNVKNGYAGWLEVELRAQPDQKELLDLIKTKHAGDPVTREILEAEAMTITQPLFIGGSLPVLVREDIALSTVPETAFRPDYKTENGEYYLWYPQAGFGKGLTAEGLKAFSSALTAGNLKSTEAAANMLIRRLEGTREPLMLEKDNNERFAIPVPVAVELITADLLTMRAVTAGNPEILETAIAAMKPCYSRPFLTFNLGSLYAGLKKSDKARKCFEQALSEIEAWPLAEKKLKKAGR